MATIFSRIIRGEIPSFRVAEDSQFYAFLDIRPMQRGHVLVVPKVEVDYLFDLDEDFLRGALPFARRVARAIEAVVPCKRVGLMVIGLEVPHAHIHLVPLNAEGDLQPGHHVGDIPEDEMRDLAARISQAFAQA